MNLEFIYRKKVDKFFSKNSHLLDKSTVRELLIKAVKRVLLREDINIDVKKLKGELCHLYRIRLNKIRIESSEQNYFSSPVVKVERF